MKSLEFLGWENPVEEVNCKIDGDKEPLRLVLIGEDYLDEERPPNERTCMAKFVIPED